MKGHKRYFVLAVIAAVVTFMIIKYLATIGDTEVVSEPGKFVQATAWTDLIVQNLNEEQVALSIDGQNYLVDSDEGYMNADRSIMICIDQITEYFSCAVHVYNGNHVVIEKGTHRIELYTGNSEITVDGEVYELTCNPIRNLSHIFIPLNLFSDYLDYSMEWN